MLISWSIPCASALNHGITELDFTKELSLDVLREHNPRVPLHFSVIQCGLNKKKKKKRNFNGKSSRYTNLAFDQRVVFYSASGLISSLKLRREKIVIALLPALFVIKFAR